MKYRALGRTGLSVSVLSLGTVALGLDYGIQSPDSAKPDESEAIRIIRSAAEAGINLFDTAPAYGESERLLGLALKPRAECLIATKVSIPKKEDGGLPTEKEIRESVINSIENSLRALRRDHLDIVQIHNATPEVIAEGTMTGALAEAKQAGKVRFIGASIYTEADALAVIDAEFDVLQAAYNLLDQRMAQRVFPAAESSGTGVIVRSALLKGVLTDKARWLPSQLAPLREAAQRSRDALDCSWETLPEAALRFCLSSPRVSSVLIGAGAREELAQSLRAEQSGPLPDEWLEAANALAMSDERLLNPSYWPVP